MVNKLNSGPLNKPNNVTRNSNFIGKSNWKAGYDLNADTIFDDIKILFPSLEDLDIADVVCFLEFFSDTTNIKETIIDVATLYGRNINENKLNIVMPTIEKFLKKYIEIKKI